MPSISPVLRAAARDLPEVPPFVQFLIGVFFVPIMAWLETLVCRPLLRRCADHPLVLLAWWYDRAAVVAACQGFHHAPGTPSACASFNPRLPGGRRPMARLYRISVEWFQSTPSGRKATRRRHKAAPGRRVSIHAFREEGDPPGGA